MTDDTTTISITTEQQERLRDIGGAQAYKHTIAELIASHDGETSTDTDAGASVDEKALAEYVADYLVEGNELPRKVAQEVRG